MKACKNLSKQEHPKLYARDHVYVCMYAAAVLRCLWKLVRKRILSEWSFKHMLMRMHSLSRCTSLMNMNTSACH